MSDNKKYYYLKLKDNFFDSDTMIVLESMADGYLYSNILMKLYLRSLKNEGKLMFNEKIPYNPTILAQVTRHSVGVVEKAIKIYSELDLIEIMDNGAIYMLDIQNYIGKSSSEADRQREYYDKIKDAKGDNLLLEGKEPCKKPNKKPNMKPTPEKEREKEKEKEKELKPKDKEINKIVIVINKYTSNLILHNAITDFITMRKTIKKPMTDRAIELLFKNLNKLATNDSEKIEILNQSIMNCYQGIFAIKQEGSNGNFRKDNTESKGKYAGIKVKDEYRKPLTDREIADLNLI